MVRNFLLEKNIYLKKKQKTIFKKNTHIEDIIRLIVPLLLVIIIQFILVIVLVF